MTSDEWKAWLESIQAVNVLKGTPLGNLGNSSTGGFWMYRVDGIMSPDLLAQIAPLLEQELTASQRLGTSPFGLGGGTYQYKTASACCWPCTCECRFSSYNRQTIHQWGVPKGTSVRHPRAACSEVPPLAARACTMRRPVRRVLQLGSWQWVEAS